MTSLYRESKFYLCVGLILGALMTLMSCNSESKHISSQNIMGHSELLALYEKDGYDEVIIFSPKGEEVAHYVLIDGHDSLPDGISQNVAIIKTPLQSAVLDSEVYAGIIEELGMPGIIKGMFDADFVTDPAWKENIYKGEIINLGTSSTPDIEKLTVMNPDVIFLSYFEGMQTQAVDKIGIPIIKMYDLQERTPLGRAEWIRFIGRLIGKGEEADKIYEKVVKDYTALRDMVHTTETRKKVLTEIMYEGVWNVACANSYQANLIKDAGGNYFKGEDNSSVTLMLTPEQILKDGHDADVWIIRYYGNENELKNILKADPIYGEIKAYKDKEVYFSDTSKSGLFHDFPFHPELLIRDYKNIFSQESRESLKYFKRLEL